MDSNTISSPDNNEDLDPRVQDELEKLNLATDEINKLETQLDDANAAFRATLSEATQKLNLLAKKLGKCIEKARPYYESKEVAQNAQIETQKAAVQYKRSNDIHLAAKETITLAEERFLSKKQEWEFDNAWQEMLNFATMKVMEAETKKRESEAEHQKRAAIFTAAENKLQILERRLKRNIAKSQPYFEMKDILQKNLEMLKDRVEQLQITVMLAKQRYAESLHNLEAISEEIHERRRITRLKIREPGVGAEVTLQLPEINLDLPKRNGTMSSTASDIGSEIDFDDDVCSQVTDDTETENLHHELTELLNNMAAAAISVNHQTETIVQKSHPSPDVNSYRYLEWAATDSNGQSPFPKITEQEEVPEEKCKINKQFKHVSVDEDAKSFVSVDLND